MSFSVVSITKEAVPEFQHGQTAANSSTPTQLTVLTRALKGVRVKSPGSLSDTPNTKNIYVGGSHVTSTTGFVLAPGEEVFIPIDDPSKLYIISGSTTPTAHWFIV